MIRTFRIPPEVLPSLRKKTIRILVPVALFSIVITLVLNTDGGSNINGIAVGVSLSLMLLLLGLSLSRSLRRQRQLVESYRLTIDGNVVTREQHNTETISLNAFEIRSIERHEKGGFVIRGGTPHDIIYVPKDTEDQEGLATLLNSLHPVTLGVVVSGYQKKSILVSLATFVLFLVFVSMSNRIALIATGFLLLGLMIWSFAEVQKNKNIDKGTKTGRWLNILGMLYIVFRIGSLLFL
jgi:uncharacterized membrane protein